MAQLNISQLTATNCSSYFPIQPSTPYYVCECVRACLSAVMCDQPFSKITLRHNKIWCCLLADEHINYLLRLTGTCLQSDREDCSAAVDQALHWDLHQHTMNTILYPRKPRVELFCLSANGDVHKHVTFPDLGLKCVDRWLLSLHHLCSPPFQKVVGPDIQ